MFSSVRPSTGLSASTIVVGVYDDLKPPKGLGSAGNAPAVKEALASERFKGAHGTVLEAVARDKRVILVGLGGKGKTDAFAIAGAVGRRLAQHGLTEANVLAEKLDWRAFGCGLGVLSWDYAQLRGSATKPKPKPDLNVGVSTASAVTEINEGLGLAASMNFARDVSQTPPNIATPEWIAEQAQKMAKETGLKFSMMKGDDLEKERMEGLINVGKASENLPCLIRLEYRPKGSKAKPVVLLGKTMTYDTGGLSLKVNNGMVGMKRDKDGGCAVLGAMHAIATVIKPDVPVVALLAAAENSISDEAYRPDDVLTYRNGVTVEVTNTDAEGRLVLADGLCWACDEEDPAAIVDVATLTGGVVTALGKVFAGYFCEDAALTKELEAASSRSGERLWRLPMHQEYKDLMKSPIADILNSNPNRQAHPIQGAAFLSYFVKDEIPWAHIDIAGVHAVDKDSGPFIPGPTAYGVRLLAEWVANRTP